MGNDQKAVQVQEQVNHAVQEVWLYYWAARDARLSGLKTMYISTGTERFPQKARYPLKTRPFAFFLLPEAKIQMGHACIVLHFCFARTKQKWSRISRLLIFHSRFVKWKTENGCHTMFSIFQVKIEKRIMHHSRHFRMSVRLSVDVFSTDGSSKTVTSMTAISSLHMHIHGFHL